MKLREEDNSQNVIECRENEKP